MPLMVQRPTKVIMFAATGSKRLNSVNFIIIVIFQSLEAIVTNRNKINRKDKHGVSYQSVTISGSMG